MIAFERESGEITAPTEIARLSRPRSPPRSFVLLKAKSVRLIAGPSRRPRAPVGVSTTVPKRNDVIPIGIERVPGRQKLLYTYRVCILQEATLKRTCETFATFESHICTSPRAGGVATGERAGLCSKRRRTVHSLILGTATGGDVKRFEKSFQGNVSKTFVAYIRTVSRKVRQIFAVRQTEINSTRRSTTTPYY